MASNPMKKTIQFSQTITCLVIILLGSQLINEAKDWNSSGDQGFESAD